MTNPKLAGSNWIRWAEYQALSRPAAKGDPGDGPGRRYPVPLQAGEKDASLRREVQEKQKPA